MGYKFNPFTGNFDLTNDAPITGSQLTLAAAGSVTISTTNPMQTYLVSGNGAAVILGSQPFGATAPVNGAEITLIGNSNTNTVEIDVNNGAKGVVGYDVTLGLGQIVTYKYNSTNDRYYIKSVSN